MRKATDEDRWLRIRTGRRQAFEASPKWTLRPCGRMMALDRSGPLSAPDVAMWERQGMTSETAGWVGRSIERVEDATLLTGRGRNIDDLGVPPGMLHADA
jgi:hypothetical protein